MEQNPHVKLKFNYQEFQNLLTEFNTQQKQGKYKPLPYNDYRLIAGKFFTNSISEVVIERVDVNNFIIVFSPTATTIYAGKMDDNSFGSFIHNYIKENQKEIMTNNTYDIWGDTVKYNESAVSAVNTVSSMSNATSSNISNYSDYSNVLGVDYNTVTSYHSLPQDYYSDIEKRLQKLEEAKVKIKEDLDDICSKLDLDYIYSKLDELLKEVTEEQRFSKYKFDDVNYEIDLIKEELLSRISELEERINTKEDKKCNKRKDNEKTMNTNKMFNFDFGFVDSNIRMSPYGMAIRNADGRYVSYDVKTGSVIDVEPFNFEGNRFMMKMPVAIKDIAVGDIVIHNHKPMFVVSTGDKITAIDIYNGEEKTILPTVNMFNFNYMTKVVSLFNFTGNNTPTAENPFGNMWPLFMLSDGNSGFSLNGANPEDSRTTMLMLMAMMGQSSMPANMFQNPMFMMALMNDEGSDMKDLMMVMAMSSAMNNSNSTGFKIPAAPAVVPPNNQ